MAISKEVLSKLLSEHLGSNIQIETVEPAGSGYHSDGFKVSTTDGNHYFVKKFKSNDLGFVFPERKVFSLMLSDGMARRSGQNPKPVGVALVNSDHASIIPEVHKDTEIYHIQEFEGGGKDYYFSTLLQRKDKSGVDEQDRDEIKKIVDYIVGIHSTKYPNSEHMNEAYNDGVRSVLNSPELTLMMLHEFSSDHPFFDLEKQKHYLGSMYEVMHRWKDRSDRLCALHGDFWGANFFFRDDGSTWVVDYSRIPWGDPGIDVGWWLCQYLWQYMETGNSYFKDLGELYLNTYEEKTGDHEIRNAVTMVLGLMGIIFIFPKFYPNIDVDLGNKWVALMEKIMETGEFAWE